MTIWIRPLLLLLLPWAGLTGKTQTPEELRQEILEIIQHEYPWIHEQNKGFLIGVIDNEFRSLLPFGTDPPGQSADSTYRDLVETGSFTKLLTADLTLWLSREKGLSLDQPLSVFFPKADFHEEAKEITIRDLLLHTSGLPKYPGDIGKWEDRSRDPFAHYPKSGLMEVLREGPEHKRNPETAHFSHVNYALLEILLEKWSGTSFVQLIEDYFGSFLDGDQIAVLDTSTVQKFSTGYDLKGQKTTHRKFLTFAASEGIALSPEALMIYLGQLLSREPDVSGDMLFEANVPSSLSKEIHFTYGMFRIVKKRFYPIFVQNGKAAGHSLFFAFVRETGTGVFVISNSAFGTADLGMMILRMLNENWKRD